MSSGATTPATPSMSTEMCTRTMSTVSTEEDGPMSRLAIRAAVGADTPAMEGVFRRASLSNAGDRPALLAHPEVLRLSEELAAGGRVRVAVSSDDTLIGFASTRRTGPGTLELDDLFVEPDR